MYKRSEESNGTKLAGIRKKYGVKWPKAQVEKIKDLVGFTRAAGDNDRTEPITGKVDENSTSSCAKKSSRMQEKYCTIKRKICSKGQTVKTTASLISSDIKQEIPFLKNKANPLKQNDPESHMDECPDGKKSFAFDEKVSTLKRSLSQKGKTLLEASSDLNSKFAKNVSEKKAIIKETTKSWQRKSWGKIDQNIKEKGP